MKRLSFVQTLIGVGALALAACGDGGPVAPIAQPVNYALHDNSYSALQRANPGAGGTETQVIGTSGGTISVAGVTLTVPRNALNGDVAITVVVPPGRDVAAEFLPHGLLFKKPVSISFDLRSSAAENATADDTYGGVYSLTLPQNGRVSAEEFFTVSVSQGTGIIQTSHFSDYEICNLLMKGFILIGG